MANVDQPLVEDGALLFAYALGDIGGSPADLMVTVVDGMNASVPGTLELLDLESTVPYAVFHLDSSLGTGATFYASGTSPSTTVNGGMFTTTEAFEGALPQVNVTATAEVYESALDQICCLATAVISPIGPYPPPCLVTRARELPSIHIDLGLVADDPIARQYLYRARMTTPEPQPGPWGAMSFSGFQRSLVSNAIGNEYCYLVEAYRLTDGAILGLVEECVPHSQGTLTEVGPTEDAIVAALDVRSCSVPATELTQAWCDANRTACADPMSMNQYACMQAMFDTVCEDHPASGESLVDLVQDATGGGGTGAAGDGGAGNGSAGASGTGTAGDGNADRAGAGGASGNAGTSAAGQGGSSAGSAAEEQGRAGMSAEGTPMDAMGGGGDGNGGCSVGANTARGARSPAGLLVAIGMVAGLLGKRRRRSAIAPLTIRDPLASFVFDLAPSASAPAGKTGAILSVLRRSFRGRKPLSEPRRTRVGR